MRAAVPLTASPPAAARHEIELRYWPRSLTWGLVVSLGATALIAGLVWRGRRP